MAEERPGTSRSQSDRLFDLSKLPRGAIGIGGLPIARNARLPSIRSPRDYNLTAAPKRTFVPNIPVRREKRTVPAPSENPPTQTDANNRTSGQVRGSYSRGRGYRGRGTFIQLPGSVFGEGVKSSKVKKLVTGKKGNESSTPKPATQPKQAKSAIKLDKVKEEDKSDSDSSDKFIDYGDLDVDDKDCELPVNLPLRGKTETQGNKSKVGKNTTVDCKDIKQKVENAKLDDDPRNIKKLLFENTNADEDQFIFMEFPQSILLPLTSKEKCRNRLNEVTMVRLNDDSSSAEPLSEGLDTSTPTWANCTEGYIGKLQLLNNGKTRLVLGDYVLDDIEMLDSSPFFQELVSIWKNPNSPDMDMTAIHPLKYNVRFMPDIEKLKEQVL